MRNSKSPSSRSVDELRKRGFVVANVEQTMRLPFGRVFKRDAYGFGDLLVVKPGWGTALVQATGGQGGNFSARIRKILGEPEDETDEKSVSSAKEVRENARIWLLSGNRILVHGWSKRGPRGARKTWRLVEREIVLSDFSSERETYEPNSAENSGERVSVSVD